jgi:putative ABC transport system permease protein
LTESLVLSLAGAALGVGLAVLGVPALVALAPGGVPRLEQAAVNGPVLAFVLALAGLTCLVAGLAPALRASRSRPAEALQSGGRAAAAVSRDRLRAVLVTAQVALALVLTTAAVLLVKSGIEVTRVDPGFRTDGVLTARLTLPDSAYGDAGRVRSALARLRAEAAALPGVAEAAVSNVVPLGSGSGGNGLWTEDRALDDPGYGELRIVDDGFLDLYAVRLLRGRAFDERDSPNAPRVMLINETLARELFPDGGAVGSRVGCCVDGDAPDFWKTVVGVVGDVRGHGLDAELRPEFYLPLGQEPPEAWRWLRGTVYLSLRTDGDPATLVNPLRRAVQRVDSDLPLYDVATLGERLTTSRASARFNTLLLTLLAALGLLLAAVGLYGTVAHLVEQRRHEIGVRMALGASARHVVTKAVTHMLPAVVAGVVLGLAGALAAGRLLKTFLFGVAASDPAALTAAVVGLVAVALTACLLPARRAARVDPVRTLNEG